MFDQLAWDWNQKTFWFHTAHLVWLLAPCKLLGNLKGSKSQAHRHSHFSWLYLKRSFRWDHCIDRSEHCIFLWSSFVLERFPLLSCLLQPHPLLSSPLLPVLFSLSPPSSHLLSPISHYYFSPSPPSPSLLPLLFPFSLPSLSYLSPSFFLASFSPAPSPPYSFYRFLPQVTFIQHSLNSVLYTAWSILCVSNEL